jgi:ribonuclease HI
LISGWDEKISTRIANSDGALNPEKRLGGCGTILQNQRNHDGNVVVARASKVDNVIDVETVELLACRQSLVLAEELRRWTTSM